MYICIYLYNNHFFTERRCSSHASFRQREVDSQLRVEFTRYFNNNLECLHKLLKKKLSDLEASRDIQSATHGLHTWMLQNFYMEARKALYGRGKYRLAPGYHHFEVNYTSVWIRWSIQRQDEHTAKFFEFVPQGGEKYVKPANAGLKGNRAKKTRRCHMPEVELFDQPLQEQQQGMLRIQYYQRYVKMQ